MRIIAVVLASLIIAGLLLFLTPRAAASQAPGTTARESAAGSQTAVRSVVILLLKGADTLVVERIQRDPRSVTAVIAGPGSPRISLQYTLGTDHLIPTTAFTVSAVNAAEDAPPMQSGSLTLTADSAFLAITAGGDTRDIRVATRAGALPIVNNDFVAIEQAVRRARAQGVTDMTVPLFALSAGQTVDASLVLVGTDSARLSLMNNITTVAIDSAGNVTGGEVAAQGVRIVVLQGDSAAAVGIAKPDYTPSDDATLVAGTLHGPPNHRLPARELRSATDQQVRPEEARMLDQALREAGNQHVTLHIFPDRNHLFLRDSVGHPSGYASLTNGKVDAEVLGVLADWLVEQLQPR